MWCLTEGSGDVEESREGSGDAAESSKGADEESRDVEESCEGSGDVEDACVSASLAAACRYLAWGRPANEEREREREGETARCRRVGIFASRH